MLRQHWDEMTRAGRDWSVVTVLTLTPLALAVIAMFLFSRGDGQTFAVAGLLNNITQNDGAAIPWISKIPILGNFFKSKADRTEQTELLVLITPRLVKPLDPDEVPALPTDPSKFLGAPPVETTRQKP